MEQGKSMHAPRGGDVVLDGAVDLARDRELVERCQAGQRAAFEELYHRYHRRLFHFCLRRLHERYEAEDAVQEAFVKAWRAIPGFAGERRFYPWLTVIAGNVCTDVLRRRQRLTPVDEVPLPVADLHATTVDEALLAQDDASMATRALGQLSERHQRVLQLREGSGWSTQRLADHEGVPVPAMETLLWRARQALKREFASLADTGGRLGVGLGLGVTALRRFVGRAATRFAGRHPAVQSWVPARGPGAVVASLALAGGVVGGAVLVAQPGPPPAAAVAMPPVTSAPAPAPARAAAVRPTPSTGSSSGRAAGSAGSSSGTGGGVGNGAAATGAAGNGAAATGAAGTAGPGGGATPPSPASVGTAGSGAPGAGAATSLVGSAAGTATSVVGAVGGTVTSVVGAVGGTVTSVVGAVGGTVTSVVGAVGSTVTGNGGTVTSVAGAVGGAVTGVAGAAGSTVSGVAGAVGGAVTGVAGSLTGGLGG